MSPEGLARLTIEDGLIKAVEINQNVRPQDADIYLPDSYLVSGLIDLQINGGLGYDFTNQPESVYQLAAQLPRWGCTGFLPTLVTSDFEAYQHSLKIIGEAQHSAKGARIFGAHLEGPYLNPNYKGAHDSRYLRPPNLAEVQKLLAAGPVRMMTLAPELPGALEIIRFLAQQGIVVSTGHSGANYEEAQAAFKAGASYVTHLFNAMPPIHHRNPGLIVAALNTESPFRPFVGVIADGIHIHPTVLKMVAHAPITLVTDAMAGMGMEPGEYRLADLDVIVDEIVARLSDESNTLAGSILTLDQAVRNAIKFFDLSLNKAVQLASLNPATVLGLQHQYGQVSPGFRADIAVLDRNLQVQMTLVNGEIAYQSTSSDSIGLAPINVT